MPVRPLTCLLLLGMTVGAWAAAPPEERTFTDGVHEIGPVPVPAGTTRGFVRLSRASWTNPASRVTWVVSVSQDGGATWTPLTFGAVRGGDVILPCVPQRPCTELPEPYSEVSAALPQPTNPARRLKATLTVVGTVTTAVTARWETTP